MNRTLIIDDEAVEEGETQAQYYAEHAGEAISTQFVAELQAVIEGLVEGRLVGVNYSRASVTVPIKRVFLHSFPFSVVFSVESDVVTVVAVEALRRRPGYWRSRLRR